MYLIKGLKITNKYSTHKELLQALPYKILTFYLNMMKKEVGKMRKETILIRKEFYKKLQMDIQMIKMKINQMTNNLKSFKKCQMIMLLRLKNKRNRIKTKPIINQKVINLKQLNIYKIIRIKNK